MDDKSTCEILNYRELVQNANSIIARIDPEGKITFFNEFAQKFFGYSEDEILGRNAVGTVVPESDSTGKNLKAMILDIGIHPEHYVNNENENVRKNGERVWISWTNKAVYDDDGNIVEILCIGNDITERNRNEMSLKASSEQWQTTFNAINDSVCILDINGKILQCNKAMEKFLGKSSGEIIGGTCWEFVHGTNKPIKGCPVVRMQETLCRETKVLNVNDKWLNVSADPIIDEEGNLISAVHIIRDITQQKRVEKTLLKSEERYRHLFEEARDGIFLSDAETGILVDCNIEAVKMVGREKSELIGQHQKILHPKDTIVEGFSETFIKHMDKHDGQVLEAQIITSAGEIKDVAIKSNTLNLGDRKYMQGIFRDITEEKKAREMIRKSEELYRSLVENIDIGVTLIDSDYNIVMTNLAHGKMFYKHMKEYVGKKCFQEFRKRNNVCPHCPGLQAMNTGNAAEIETNALRDDGSTFDARVCAFPISESDGAVTGFIEIVEDITEKRKIEIQVQKAQKMQAIGTLAGGIAHNFNNLLMGIQGNISLMQLDMDISHVYYNRLKSIEKQIQNGVNLTSQILGYASKGKYVVKSISLNPLVNEVSSTFGQTRRDILIHKKLYKDLFAIEADKGQIEQILLNLFVNAADAMPGGGNLFLETKNVSHKDMNIKLYKPEAGNYVLLTVKDTGAGIDKSNIEHIFEPFFTTKEMGRGTGLGLASVYGIIKSHGGYIEVESMKEQGTTFKLYLPASESKFREDTKTSAKLIKGSGTVFLVDDEEVVQEVCKELLKNIGYSVLSAKNGKEALELYRNNQDNIDIVLLDMIMPNMNGGEVYDRMKEINPDIKVLLSSGYTIDGEATEILNRGCNGFIQKPFDLNELSGKISKILNKK